MKAFAILLLLMWWSASAVGQEFDGEGYNSATGLCYFRQRSYDPETGTFVTKDPLGIASGTNGYLYVLNNPVPMATQSRVAATES